MIILLIFLLCAFTAFLIPFQSFLLCRMFVGSWYIEITDCKYIWSSIYLVRTEVRHQVFPQLSDETHYLSSAFKIKACKMLMVSGCAVSLQDHPHIWKFTWRMHGTQHIVVHTAKIYYSDVICTTSQIKRGMGSSRTWRNPCVGFLLLSSSNEGSLRAQFPSSN